MRARLALAVSEQSYTLHEVDLKNRPPELFAVSPKGTVPVLVLDDGMVLLESLDIMFWALANHDPQGWLRSSLPQQQGMQALLEQCDGAFKFHLDRYKYATRFEGVIAEEHRQQAATILMAWEERLTQHNFLCDNRVSMADMALGPFVRQFAFANRPWFDAQAWPHLRQWLDAFTASALFAQIMEKP
jgi:glutathione S-transferase